MAQRVTENARVLDSIPTEGMNYFECFHSLGLIIKQNAALNSTEHAIFPNFGENGVVIRFPVLTLLHAGYSVKLKK